MASFERCANDEHGNLVKITIGGDTELVLTGSCVLATSATAPPGTLIADGSEVSRASYPELFAKIGTTYGDGDGVTTFALPDWRDEFPRFSGSARAVGSKQSDAIRNITASLTIRAASNPNSLSYMIWDEMSQNAFYVDAPYGNGETDTLVGSNEVLGRQRLHFDASRSVQTAAENRPVNVALLWCIIYE